MSVITMDPVDRLLDNVDSGKSLIKDHKITGYIDKLMTIASTGN